ncbi:hypothetical protein LTR56_015915 [Elasticomyces elasticus]|nr:hypothetical protein LTR56_015915 [Elasticomyces elasticus]KAK3655328.1 hypothetical protein LTR22_010358 [Elasticomyces elasticus]KAK4918684.1 hypothetical protein LTR49_013609 [Elasticomyces elasticus]KAK5744071.1 hypothetical protein LTS12_023641 [Elasticomyces elasticus]
MVPFRIAAAWLALWTVSARALGQQYCSSENTGSDYQAVFNIYQSNGACHDQCQDNYAFAVVQWQNCWCSNYIPADQQSTGNCSEDCPGYPDEQCGNESAGLYGYIPLYRHPRGTAGGSSSTQASSTPASSSTPEPSTQSSTQESSTQFETTTSQPETSPPQATSYVSQTVYQTQTQTQTVIQSQSASIVVSYVTPTPSTSSSSVPSSTSTFTTSSSPAQSSTVAPIVAPVPASSATSSNSSPPSATPSPVTSVRVITVSGAAVTQTVTSTPFADPDNNANALPLQRKQMSGGAIAGIVIGALVGLAALLFGFFLLWRRRRENDDNETSSAVVGRGPKSPRRNISVLSRTGLLSRGQPTSMVETNPYDEGLHVHTGQNSVRHSMLFGATAIGAEGGVSPVSPLGSTHDNDSTKRYSRPMVYDQRLNPSALFANGEANRSRVSMQDQQDYSRPLGVTNPDPRPSFESRAS